MKFEYHDGGRSKYFAKETVRDCVVRAIAIASGRDYKEVYNKAKEIIGYTPRNGVKCSDTHKIMKAFGGEWNRTGGNTHLCEGEIPMRGHIICNLKGHVTAVINGVIYDTYDCSDDGYRSIYGYWRFKRHKPFKAYVKYEREKTKDDMTYQQHQVFGVYKHLVDYIQEIDWALPACDDDEKKEEAQEVRERLCRACVKCRLSFEDKRQYTAKQFKSQPNENTLWRTMEDLNYYLFDTVERLDRITANMDDCNVWAVRDALYY